MKYYKVLGKGGVPCNGGTGQWYLPKDGKPGRWMPKIRNIEPCVRGYHLCRKEDILQWLNAEIYEAEGRGEFIRHDNNKEVFPEARLIRKIENWNEKNARLFAADCADHVLHIFEKERPNNDRPRRAIQAARDFALGKIEAAARAAAGAAAGDAAWAAAWAAAMEAARAAAWAAAWAAAGDAAGAAAREAAREAARAAAWAAAWEAAREAEKKWQTKTLFKYLVRK
jgi:hypothetical protein